MSELMQPTSTAEDNSSTRTIAIAVVAIFALAGLVALFLRGKPQGTSGPPPYAANIKLSDFKMSAAENFVGATVSYIDGTVSNSGLQTVTHIMVAVLFKDDLGQIAQREDVALKVVKSNGAYPEPVDLNLSPLGPGQTQPFRLTFESISAQWNHQYPEIQITNVTAK
ncbi:MAG TPA: hypothetical protein VI386_29185 [Candidatus Sulfotelmatobacter sp.]